MSCCRKALASILSANYLIIKDGRRQNYYNNNSRRRQTLFLSSRISGCRSPTPYDIFISHRGTDTMSNVAALLYDCFVRLNLHPFLDYKSMKPGEKLEEETESAIRDCKVGVAIFSPNHCISLHELALMIECEKKLISIFYDVNTSDLVLVDNGTFPANQLRRFSVALELAKGRVGISFDSCKGDWSDLLKRVSERVVELLKELEDEEKNEQSQ